MLKSLRSLALIGASLFINFSCMQDHQPAPPVVSQSYRPIDARIGSGSDRTTSTYEFLGYQDGDLNQFDLASLAPITKHFGLVIRQLDPANPGSWWMEGALSGPNYRVSATVPNPLYDVTADWKPLESVAGSTFRGVSSTGDITEDLKYIKYFFHVNAFRMDQVGGKTYVRFRAVAEGETQPVGMVFLLK